MTAGMLLAELGATDCERLGGGLLAQPVNTVTSLAYVAAGAWVVWRGSQQSHGDGLLSSVYGGVLALVGAGSILFHGPQVIGAKLLHDVPIEALLGLAAAVPVLRWRRSLPLLPGWTRSRGLVLGASSALGVVAYALGRTGSPLCEPDSLLQLHGLWHVLSAVALGAWGSVLFEPVRQAAVPGVVAEPA